MSDETPRPAKKAVADRPRLPRIQLVIESDATEVSEVVLRLAVAEAASVVNGRINVTRAALLVDGIALEGS